MGHIKENKMITVGKGNNKYLLEMLNICQEYLEEKITCFTFKNTLFKKKISNFCNIEVGNGVFSQIVIILK